MTPTQAREEAERIVAEYQARHDVSDNDVYHLIEAISTALLTAAKVKEGCVRTSDGVERTIRVSETNTERPIYGTALLSGETVIVLEAAEAAQNAEKKA